MKLIAALRGTQPLLQQQGNDMASMCSSDHDAAAAAAAADAVAVEAVCGMLANAATSCGAAVEELNRQIAVAQAAGGAGVKGEG